MSDFFLFFLYDLLKSFIVWPQDPSDGFTTALRLKHPMIIGLSGVLIPFGLQSSENLMKVMHFPGKMYIPIYNQFLGPFGIHLQICGGLGSLIQGCIYFRLCFLSFYFFVGAQV